jgi:hypothetical protein
MPSDSRNDRPARPKGRRALDHRRLDVYGSALQCLAAIDEIVGMGKGTGTGMGKGTGRGKGLVEDPAGELHGSRTSPCTTREISEPSPMS